MSIKGWAGAIQGNKVFVDLGEKGMATFEFNDRDVAWSFYCKNIKIELEEANESTT